MTKNIHIDGIQVNDEVIEKLRSLLVKLKVEYTLNIEERSVWK